MKSHLYREKTLIRAGNQTRLTQLNKPQKVNLTVYITSREPVLTKAFVIDQNYSHISDVTTARNDTYSHTPAQPRMTTQGKKDESYSDNTYNHLSNTVRLGVRDNNKDSSDEYSNIGNLPMTKNAGQHTPHKIALDKHHGETLSDL